MVFHSWQIKVMFSKCSDITKTGLSWREHESLIWLEEYLEAFKKRMGKYGSISLQRLSSLYPSLSASKPESGVGFQTGELSVYCLRKP